MQSEKKRLYNYILILSILALIGLVLSNKYKYQKEHESGFCLLKRTVGYPCPSCGTTRSVSAFFRGEISEAMMLNPMGIIASLLLVTLPLWILSDKYTRKDSFFRFYKKTEQYLRKPLPLVMIIMLMLSNWIWNIFKGL